MTGAVEAGRAAGLSVDGRLGMRHTPTQGSVSDRDWQARPASAYYFCQSSLPPKRAWAENRTDSWHSTRSDLVIILTQAAHLVAGQDQGARPTKQVEQHLDSLVRAQLHEGRREALELAANDFEWCAGLR